MEHPWPYKQIGTLSSNLVNKIANKVRDLEYKSAVDFSEDVITVSPHVPFRNEVLEELRPLFNPAGHVYSNIARLHSLSYMREHSDLKTKEPLLTKHPTIVKIQIPIITNDGVAMMWLNEGYSSYVKKFELGGIYIIDNIRVHSVINLGNEHRYNLTTRFKIESVIDPKMLD